MATWTGGSATTDNWTDADNWGGVAPVAGDALIFAGTTRLSPVNDFAADTSFASITFDNTAGAFTLSGARITLTGNITNNDADAQTITLDVIISGATRTVACTSGAIAMSGVISGTQSLTKSGNSTLTLSGANTYSGGTTTISAGTLALTGGDDRLPTGGTVAFSASSALSTADSQTLANVTVADSFTGTISGGGDLTLTGSSFSIGTTAAAAGTITTTLTMTGLASFFYNNSAGTFSVGGTPTGGNGTAVGNVSLPPIATITASLLRISNPHPNNAGRNRGTLTLGKTTTINATTITVGNTRAEGYLQYSSVTDPTLNIRASDGTSPVTSMTIASGSAIGSNPYPSTVDLTAGVTGTSTLDATITTLTLGYITAYSQNVSYTGTFTMGAGTLVAGTIYLGRNSTGATTTTTTSTGTMTVSGGTLTVTTLYLADQNASTATHTVVGTFNLNNGATLYATTVSKGPGTGTQAATRTFNWSNGTIKNIAGGNLTWTDVPITLTSGTHTFEIESGRTASTCVLCVISGATFGIVKDGLGTLVLAATNLYTGATTLTAGILLVNGSTAAGSAVSVASGATLGGSGTVAGTITSASGGKIAPGATGVSIATLNTGAVTLTGGALYEVDLNGTTPTFDKINSSGNVNLASATLTVANLANSTLGRTYTIVQAAGTISGLFNGLANNDTFLSGGTTLRISYTPTTVTLTEVNPPAYSASFLPFFNTP